MKNLMVKTSRREEVRNSEPYEIMRIVSEEDIRRRAYEIYLENRDTQFDDTDNWLCAERELMGFE
jgi:hypothetical protein